VIVRDVKRLGRWFDPLIWTRRVHIIVRAEAELKGRRLLTRVGNYISWLERATWIHHELVSTAQRSVHLLSIGDCERC